MPYTPKNRRVGLLVTRPAEAPGDLAWQLSELVEKYRRSHGTSFQTIAEIRGAIDATEDEFRRQVQEPYEELKLRENGPVFERGDT